jgi:hypothetical protein
MLLKINFSQKNIYKYGQSTGHNIKCCMFMMMTMCGNLIFRTRLFTYILMNWSFKRQTEQADTRELIRFIPYPPVSMGPQSMPLMNGDVITPKLGQRAKVIN